MVILTSVSIAVSSKKYFPDMVYSANTTGVNMIMSAYDKAFGGFDDRVFEEGEIGYLPGAVDSTRIPVRRYPGAELIYQTTDRYLYKEYDAFYKERAMDWIKHNPIKWLGMMPKKFAIAYCDTDYFSFSVNEDATDYRKLPSIMKFWNIVFAEWLWRVMVGLALLGLMTPFWRNNRIIYLYSTIALCTGATLLSAALPRYNFPMITMVVLLCVYTVKFYASRLSHNRPQ